MSQNNTTAAAEAVAATPVNQNEVRARIGASVAKFMQKIVALDSGGPDTSSLGQGVADHLGGRGKDVSKPAAISQSEVK